MAKKFIPNGDYDFVTMAEVFAHSIAKDPAQYEIAQKDADELGAAVSAYREALQVCRSSNRSAAATRTKEDTRATAERIIRRLGHLVRANPRLDAAMKINLGIRPRAEKAKILPCPQEPPKLSFVRALHERNAVPVHELKFTAVDWTKSKPPGAVRLELFVDLVAPNEPIPTHPGANHASRAWYLRSYTRSPIRLTPPMPRVPMRVVYWGRWADSLGNVGPFSATAAGWIEGGSHAHLPGGVGLALGRREAVPILEDTREPGTDGRERTYVVAVLEAQDQSMLPHLQQHLPAPPERQQRQLAAPAEKAA